MRMCFDPLPVKSSCGEELQCLGFFEQFRKLYAIEEYSEVAKMFIRVTVMEGEHDSFLAMRLKLSLRYSNMLRARD